MVFVSDATATLRVDGNLANYAYRDFGAHGSTPLVLLQRFRATLDHWDPAFWSRSPLRVARDHRQLLRSRGGEHTTVEGRPKDVQSCRGDGARLSGAPVAGFSRRRDRGG